MRKLNPEQMLLRYVLCDRPYLEMQHTPTYRRMVEAMSLHKVVRTKLPRNKKLYHAHVNHIENPNPKSGIISCSTKSGVIYFCYGYEEQYKVYEVNNDKVREYIYVPDAFDYLYDKRKLNSLNAWQLDALDLRRGKEKEFIIPYENGLLSPVEKWRWQ